MRFAKPKMNRKFDEVISEVTQSAEPMGIIESILHETILLEILLFSH